MRDVSFVHLHPQKHRLHFTMVPYLKLKRRLPTLFTSFYTSVRKFILMEKFEEMRTISHGGIPDFEMSRLRATRWNSAFAEAVTIRFH